MSCTALGLPLYVSLSRKDFIGAVLAGSWEERLPAAEREWGTVAAAALAVARRRRDPPPPRRSLSPGDAGRRQDRAAAGRSRLMREEPLRGSLVVAIEPGREDGRLVAESSEGERDARRVAAPRAARPRLRRRAARRRRRAPLLAPGRGARAAAPATWSITSGTASGKTSPSTSRCSTHRARPEAPRALPLPDQGARPGPGAQARRAAAAGLRQAIYDGDTPREERPAIRGAAT